MEDTTNGQDYTEVANIDLSSDLDVATTDGTTLNEVNEFYKELKEEATPASDLISESECNPSETDKNNGGLKKDISSLDVDSSNIFGNEDQSVSATNSDSAQLADKSANDIIATPEIVEEVGLVSSGTDIAQSEGCGDADKMEPDLCPSVTPDVESKKRRLDDESGVNKDVEGLFGSDSEPPMKKVASGDDRVNAAADDKVSAVDKEASGDDKVSADDKEASGDDKVSADDKEATGDDKAPGEEPEKAKDAELEKYWKAVVESPLDFIAWTYLLQYVEHKNVIEDARKAFDDFLSRYPYCYGYWKKYADMEKRHSHIDKSEQVLERGLAAIPLSVDLWLHYVKFKKEQVESDKSVTEEDVRRVLERGVTACGMEYRSDKLWEEHIQWERSRETTTLTRVITLYHRLLATPTHLHNQHYDRFLELVQSSVPRALLSDCDFLKLHKQYTDTKRAAAGEDTGGADTSTEPDSTGTATDTDGETAVATQLQPPATDTDAPVTGTDTDTDITGTDKPATTEAGSSENTATDGTTTPDISAIDDEENQYLREQIIDCGRRLHEKTEQQISAIQRFEDGIKRPYFHVKPLERSQLNTWDDYLDYSMQHDTQERCEVLFERCLIACALYEEYWLKYAHYMAERDTDKCRDIYRRACRVHLRFKKPNLHLAWATYEEILGNVESALEVLDMFDADNPKMLVSMLRRVNIVRRRGSEGGEGSGEEDPVVQLFNQYLQSPHVTANPNIYIFLCVKLARYWLKIRGNLEECKKTLYNGLCQHPSSMKLYVALLDTLCSQYPVGADEVQKVFDGALACTDLPLQERYQLSNKYVHFMEDFSASASKLSSVLDAHRLLVSEYQAMKKEQDGGESESAAAAGGTSGSTAAGDASQPAAAAPDPHYQQHAAAAGYQHPGYPPTVPQQSAGGDPAAAAGGPQYMPQPAAAAAAPGYDPYGQGQAWANYHQNYYAMQQQQQQAAAAAAAGYYGQYAAAAGYGGYGQPG